MFSKILFIISLKIVNSLLSEHQCYHKNYTSRFFWGEIFEKNNYFITAASLDNATHVSMFPSTKNGYFIRQTQRQIIFTSLDTPAIFGSIDFIENHLCINLYQHSTSIEANTTVIEDLINPLKKIGTINQVLFFSDYKYTESVILYRCDKKYNNFDHNLVILIPRALNWTERNLHVKHALENIPPNFPNDLINQLIDYNKFFTSKNVEKTKENDASNKKNCLLTIIISMILINI